MHNWSTKINAKVSCSLTSTTVLHLYRYEAFKSLSDFENLQSCTVKDEKI